jgi:hypothetical protein
MTRDIPVTTCVNSMADELQHVGTHNLGSHEAQVFL